jgi:hypothetical protein
VTYQYRPRDAAYPTLGHHDVDVALYDRVRIGDRVTVRYRRLPVVGAVFGDDSALEGTSWWTRAPRSSESSREIAELSAIAATGLLGFVAYRRRSRILVALAATAGVTIAASILLFGFLVFPTLFWIWRRRRAARFGWALIASIALSTVALYYRVPWPAPLPGGPVGHATAVVRDVRLTDHIWASAASAGNSTSGQGISRPFQLIDLEFTPQGRVEPVHALDAVDAGSFADLRPGVTVPVVYAVRDPRAAARMTVGTREYGTRAFVSILGLTFGGGAIVAFLVLPLLFAADKLLAAFTAKDAAGLG